jgi:hypothetical protein
MGDIGIAQNAFDVSNIFIHVQCARTLDARGKGGATCRHDNFLVAKTNSTGLRIIVFHLITS